jgi:hypothetical protein
MIAAPLTLAGCAGSGLAAKAQSRNQMMATEQAYRSCLLDHPSTPQACAGLREAYDADMRMYRATTAGIQGGTNNTLSVNVEQR